VLYHKLGVRTKLIIVLGSYYNRSGFLTVNRSEFYRESNTKIIQEINNESIQKLELII